MIHYQLRCGQAHEFDGWFKDSGSFERQAQHGLIECPECGGTDVQRALMAPAVTKRDRAPPPVPAAGTESQPASASGSAGAPGSHAADMPVAADASPVPENVAVGGRIPAQVLAVLQRMRAEVEKNCDYVGPEFADEARKIHRGESEHRAIYGEATDEQAESLEEEGISVGRLPWVPRADG